MRQKIYILLVLLLMSRGETLAHEPLPILSLPNHEATISIMFGGDVMFHTPQISAMSDGRGGRDVTGTFRYIRESWRGCDVVIFNLETTLSKDQYSGYPMFAAPSEVAQNLSDCGVTHLALANNHICDKSAQGIRNTLQYIAQAEIQSVGCYADSVSWLRQTPLFIMRDGFKIALLNYTYGTNGMPTPRGMVVPKLDTTQIARDIARAKAADATNIILFAHWGYEYHSQPSAEQISLAEWLHGCGVDIVVGSHPHVIQPTHVDSLGVTIYSLGNLISNQRKRYTNGGLLVRLDITHNILSGHCDYQITHLPHFVYKAPLGDSPRYNCVPHTLVDSLIPDAQQRLDAKLFFEDTQRLLSEGVKKK